MTRLAPPRLARAWAALALAAVFVVALGSVARAQSAAQSAADQALEAWDIGEAEAMIERLLADEADAPWNLYLKGKLFLMKGDYRAAADWLSQAQTREPNLVFQHHLQLALNTHEETKDYVRHRTKSGYFEIATAKGVDEILIPYAEETLEQAYRELTRIFDYTPELPIRIEFYPTVDVLGSVSPLTVAEIRTSGTIALCKYNRLMVTSPRDLVYGYDWLDTIAHELIHLLITKKSKNSVPIWLHEGLAKYYEVMWRADQKPSLDRHSESFLATALQKDQLISFEAMSPSMAKLPSQEATATAFAEVWTVVKFLNERRGKDVAAELVAAMRDGQSDREAVAAVSGIPWDRFERSWKGFLKQQGYRPLDADYQQRLLFKGKDTESDELAEIKIDRAREFVWLGDQMRLRKRWTAAILEYEKAGKHVGDRSPLVQGKLGYALLRAKRFEQAADELQKPIVDHPRHVVLHVYLGEALLELGRYEEARRHLEEALTLNPFDPDVHGNLAKVYEHLGLPDLAAREREADRRLKQE
ncbi:MAG: tetratricopeptide repeat protein [Deltaproteobacteria bacterium]|nr:tetratricopeptide repeat protein [Deltaproteobacteria bacterium]